MTFLDLKETLDMLTKANGGDGTNMIQEGNNDNVLRRALDVEVDGRERVGD